MPPSASSAANFSDRLAAAALGGPESVPRPPPGPRQAAAARAGRPAAGRRQPVPGDRPAGRRGHVRRRAPGAGLIAGIGLVHGRHVLVVSNDATVKGGTYYPDDRQEAPAGPGDRAGEPAALHLPGRLRRRLPAQAGRGLPGPRPLRPHLLQPGADVRGQDPADRRGAGLLHRRRRLRAGDERRDGDRAQPGHHLPGRPAAGEGGDRRDRHRRGTRRRRTARAHLRRHRPPGRERRARAGDRARHRRHAARARRPAWDVGARRARRPTPASSTAPCRSDVQRRLRRARGHRPAGGRQPSSTSSSASTAPRWSPGSPGSTGTRWASSPTTACCSRESALKGAHFIELCDQRGIPLLFLQNISGFMVGRDVRGRRHRQARRQDGHRRRHAARAEADRRDRRLVRRRQLLHVRPRLLAAFPLDVAGQPDLGDGRRRRPPRCWPPSSATSSRPAGSNGRAEDEDAFKAPIREQYEAQGSPYYSTARLWDDGIIDPAQTPAPCWGSPSTSCANTPLPETAFGLFRM